MSYQKMDDNRPLEGVPLTSGAKCPSRPRWPTWRSRGHERLGATWIVVLEGFLNKCRASKISESAQLRLLWIKHRTIIIPDPPLPPSFWISHRLIIIPKPPLIIRDPDRLVWAAPPRGHTGRQLMPHYSAALIKHDPVQGVTSHGAWPPIGCESPYNITCHATSIKRR